LQYIVAQRLLKTGKKTCRGEELQS
jgi:hypothetical protein